MCMYVCMYICMAITYNKDKDQSGMIARPTRGQLSKENELSPVTVRVLEFGLARHAQSRSASACSSLNSD